MDASLILDAIIAVLLVTTIGYAVVLNRKLGALRSAKSEMEALVARFAESSDKVGSGIESLKDEAKELGVVLQDRMDAARGPADELAFLIERGSGLADRLDAAVGAARAITSAGDVSSPARSARARADKGPVTPAGADSHPGAGPFRPGYTAGKAAGAASQPGDSAGAAAPPDRSASGSDAQDPSAQESELLTALRGIR